MTAAASSWSRDTGIGIAPDDLTRVLQPFAQAESGLNRRYEGTGLGLPLTRGLVELHGGSFRLESELGRAPWRSSNFR